MEDVVAEKKQLILTIVKASGLRQPTFGTLRCCVVISVDGTPVQRTKTVKGKDPQWDESFSLTIEVSSTVKIEVFHHTTFRDQLMGATVLDDLSSAKDIVERTQELSEPEKNVKHQGSLTLRFRSERAGSAIPKPPAHLEPAFSALSEASSSLNKLSNMPVSTEPIGSAVAVQPGQFAVVLERVQKVVKIGSAIAELHPYAKVAWTVLASIPQALVAQLDRDAEVRALWVAAADMLDFLKEADPVLDDPAVAQVVKAMMQQIYECALFIREFGRKGYLGRALRDASSASSDQSIGAFTTAFEDLKQRFMSRSTVKTWKIVREIQSGVIQLGIVVETIETLEKMRLLDHLPGANIPHVRWDLANVCLPNTRVELIDEIVRWANDPGERSIFWLRGVAGSGKSTVSNTIAKIFDRLGRLAGSFRFSRDVSQRNEPTYLFGNLAYQFAHFSPQIRHRLLAAIDRHGHMGSFPLVNQFQTYIFEVLQGIDFSGPVVVVIDALDESGNEYDRAALLEALVSEDGRLPECVRLLIISRNEADIRERLESISTWKAMDEVANTSSDIRSFIDHRMPQIRKRSQRLAVTDWPSEAAREKLVEKSHNLFIWAVVACRYIQGRDPVLCLEALISSGSAPAESPLDQLYLRILQDISAEHSMPFRQVVGSIVVAMTPLTIETLDALIGFGSQTGDEEVETHFGTAESVIGLLGSIFQREGGTQTPVRVLHPSLLDFFANPRRCTDSRFYLEPAGQHRSMLLRCVTVMNNHLKRDICEIDDPTKLNSEVTDLAERLTKYIPEHLRYACRFWGSHIFHSGDGVEEMGEKTRQFFFTHLLHWIEVMSLLGEFNVAFSTIEAVNKWFESSPGNDITRLVTDVLRLLQQFEFPIRQSAAHIYMSAFTSMPRNTTFAEVYSPISVGVPTVQTGFDVNWSPCLAVYTSPQDVSPDRLRFATKSSGSIDIRSTVTGAILCSVPTGREQKWQQAWCTFTSDGQYVVVDHFDAQVQLWNLFTGAAWLGPIPSQAHAISPDGAYLATLSASDTITVWDLVQKRVVSETSFIPKHNHRSVTLLDFSPNSRLLLRVTKVYPSHNSALEAFVEFAVSEVSTGLVEFEPRTESATSGVDGQSSLYPTVTWLDEDHVLLGAGDTVRVLRIAFSDTVYEWKLEQASFVVGVAKSLILTHEYNSSGLETSNESVRRGVLCLRHLNGKVIAGPFPTPAPPAKYPSLRIFSFSDDRKCLCICTESSIHVIDCITGAEIGSAAEHTLGWPTTISWTLDNKQVFIGHKNGILQVWKIYDGQQLRFQVLAPSEFSYIHALTVPQNSSRFLVRAETIQLFDLSMLINHSEPILNSTLRITTQSQKLRRITSVTTSNDNTRLACCFDDFSLELWHIGTGVIIGNRLVGHSDEINCATFCDDGRRVVSASADTTIRLWDADQGCSWGNPIRGHSGSVTSVAFNSGQGNKIASASLDKTIRIWDTLTGTQLWLSMQRIENLALISFSRNDTKLVCTTHMYPGFKLDPIVLDVETSQSWIFPPLRWMTFSSNDKIVSLSGNGDFWLWNPVSNYLAGSVSNSFPEHTNLFAVRFSPKRTQAVCIYEETFLAIPDTATGNYVQLPIPECLDDILAIQWLDGKKLVAIASKHVLRMRDAATCTVLAERYWGAIKHCVFSSDGSRIACSEEISHRFHVRDVRTTEMVWCCEKRIFPPTIAFSDDDKRIFCNGIQQFVFDAQSGEILTEYPIPVEEQHITNAHSTDRAKLASISVTTTIAVFDTTTGLIIRPLFTCQNADIRPSALEYSPDGTLVACVTRDAVLIWDTRAGTPSRTLEYPVGTTIHVYGQRLVFSPDSTRIACCVPLSFSTAKFFIWNISDTVLVGVIEGDYRNFGFSLDGTRFCTRENSAESQLLHQWLISGKPGGLTHVEPDANAAKEYISTWNDGLADISSPDGNISVQSGPQVTVSRTATKQPIDIVNRSLAYLNPNPWQFAFPSDSKSLTVLFANSAIALYDLAHLESDALVVLYNSPPENPIHVQRNSMRNSTDAGPIDASGWLYGYTGKRILWLTPMKRKIWAATGRHLILEDTHGQLVIIDLVDYLKSHPQVNRAWRPGGFRVEYDSSTSDELAMAVHLVNIADASKGKNINPSG
ncbi:hypothetical protein C8J57DRAFT_1721846 [Mycena rebaudengoi]|nr:hypothetical protein C8J57DRAFT_1721846 [Mycena rebaudengoi]